MKIKRILGIILSILFISIFFGVLAKITSVVIVLRAIGFAILLVLAIVLCLWLLISE